MNNSSDKCTCLEVFGEDPTCDLHGGPLRLAVHETFGGRCDQFDPECETCQAWAEIDRLEALTASRAQGVTDGRTQIPLATIMQEPVAIGYTNWRGEYGVRNICPIKVWFGSTDWHPEPQWLLTAIDMDKNAERDFAIKDIGRNEAAQLPARPVVPNHCYDPENWEYTASWKERQLLIDECPTNEIIRVSTLIDGPDKFALWLATEDETEQHWFDSREEAEAFLSSALEGEGHE